MIVSEDLQFNDICEEDIVIESGGFLTLSGIANKNITVKNNGILTLNGICDGDIHISENSKVIIRGIANANVVNYGKLQISGIVNHLINFSDDAEILPGPVVDGVQR